MCILEDADEIATYGPRCGYFGTYKLAANSSEKGAVYHCSHVAKKASIGLDKERRLVVNNARNGKGC